jgi:hypothetical protein
MKSLKLLVIGLFFVWSCAEEDVNSPAQSEVFIKYFGVNSNQTVDLVTYSYMEKGVEEIGYIILAQNESENDADFYLIRTDKNGDEVYSKLLDIGTYDPSQSSSTLDIPKRIKPIGNGEFLVVGAIEVSAGNYDGVWFQTDTSLAIGDMHFSSGVENVDIIKINGYDEYITIGNQSSDIILQKWNSDGSESWSSYLSFDGTEEALALFENSNGNLFIVGSSDVYDSDGEGINLFVLETNPRGTDESNGVPFILNNDLKSYDDIPTAVIKTTTGYSIVGYTIPSGTNTENGAKGFVVNVSRTADILNTHVFEYVSQISKDVNQFETTWPQAVTVDYAGYLSISGRLPDYSNKQDEMMIMRLHPSLGFTETEYPYCRSFGRLTGDDAINAVITHPIDGDLVMAGTIDFGSGTSLISLMKLSKTGELMN